MLREIPMDSRRGRWMEAALRRCAFLRVQAQRAQPRRMKGNVFIAIFAFLVGLRLASILVMLAAWRGWLLDPAYWVSGGTLAADHVTPFHGHPNPFGWRFGFHGLVALHVITGIGLFLTCVLPLVTKKTGPWHRRFGRAFVGLWLVHLFDGLANSSQILLVRGFEPTRYADVIGKGFSLYLYMQFAFISCLVIDFLAQGLAALYYKDQAPSRLARATLIGLPLSSFFFGVGLLVWAVGRLSSDAPPATPAANEFAVIFLVQVPAYLFLVGKNIAYWLRRRGELVVQHDWLAEHQRNMTFLVQVTLYTGLANTTMKYAPSLTPFLFASIDIGFLVWIFTRERALRRAVFGSRLALAFVMWLRRSRGGTLPMSVRGSVSPVPPAVWAEVTAADLNGDGEIDRRELDEMLRTSGVVLNDDELDAVFARLDPNRDGRISRYELEPFLGRYCADEPAEEDAALYGHYVLRGAA